MVPPYWVLLCSRAWEKPLANLVNRLFCVCVLAPLLHYGENIHVSELLLLFLFGNGMNDSKNRRHRVPWGSETTGARISSNRPKCMH